MKRKLKRPKEDAKKREEVENEKGNIQPQSKLISITQNGNLNGDPHFVLVNDVDDDISVRLKFSFNDVTRLKCLGKEPS